MSRPTPAEVDRITLPAMPDDGRDSILVAATNLWPGALIDVDYLSECCAYPFGDGSGDYGQVTAIYDGFSSEGDYVALDMENYPDGAIVGPSDLVRVIKP